MRSDSVVIHEEIKKKETSSTNVESQSANPIIEANATSTIQCLLQSIRLDTEKYFVAQEGIVLQYSL